MRTVVLCDGVPGAATGEVLSLRKAKQPARTSQNQTIVRSAGRQTIAITTPLNMALASSLETPLRNASLHETARTASTLSPTEERRMTTAFASDCNDAVYYL